MPKVPKDPAWVKRAKNNKQLKQRVEEYLQEEYDFFDRLTEFTERGGHTDIDQVTVEHAERDGDVITCKALVEFTETITTSCSNSPTYCSKSCTMTFIIDEFNETESSFEEHWDGKERGW